MCPKREGVPRAYRTPTYRSWESMRQRCYCKSSPSYYNYGERGIKVCERWDTYAYFLEDMGERPAGHSIDRLDNNKDYCKENCKWSTRKEQANNRRDNHLVGGMTLTQFAEQHNITPNTVYYHMKRVRCAWPRRIFNRPTATKER